MFAVSKLLHQLVLKKNRHTNFIVIHIMINSYTKRYKDIHQTGRWNDYFWLLLLFFNFILFPAFELLLSLLYVVVFIACIVLFLYFFSFISLFSLFFFYLFVCFVLFCFLVVLFEHVLTMKNGHQNTVRYI